MDTDLLQRVRYNLQKRFRRVNSAGFESYHLALAEFWDFINSTPMLSDTLTLLAAACPDAVDSANKILDGQGLVGETGAEAAAIAYFVVKACIESEKRNLERNIGFIYARGSRHDDNNRKFTELFVEPLYESLDEGLDESRAILSLVHRYKQKAEWFCREELFARVEEDTRRGERLLAAHLYEYLHDQGVSFSIEPASASGRVDLLAAQTGHHRLVADAKIFDPEKGKSGSYLASGFKQLYVYAEDHNEPAGYLVIFNISARDLRLNFKSETSGTPFVMYNGKAIFFVVIDIFPHADPASKRGRLRPYEITEQDLISADEAEAPPNPNPAADG